MIVKTNDLEFFILIIRTSDIKKWLSELISIISYKIVTVQYNDTIESCLGSTVELVLY